MCDHTKRMYDLLKEIVDDEPTHCVGEGYDSTPSCLFCDKEVPYTLASSGSSIEDRHSYESWTRKDCWFIRAYRLLKEMEDEEVS